MVVRVVCEGTGDVTLSTRETRGKAFRGVEWTADILLPHPLYRLSCRNPNPMRASGGFWRTARRICECSCQMKVARDKLIGDIGRDEGTEWRRWTGASGEAYLVLVIIAGSRRHASHTHHRNHPRRYEARRVQKN